MTSVQVPRHPTRDRFESIHFANVGSLTGPVKSREASKTVTASSGFDDTSSSSIFRDGGGLAERRSRKSASLPGGAIITQTGRLPKHELVDKRTKRARQRRQAKRLFRKFQLVGHIVLLCARAAKKHKLRNKVYDEISPFIGGLAFHDYESTVETAMKGVELMFDRNKFKADKQLRIGEDTKRILTLHPEDRSEQEIRYALLSLRNISSFAEYPLRMQKKIAQVGLYEKFEAKRVIVRQGHPASAFYFILSGSVVVMVTAGELQVAKPTAYLVKGMTFGELALINGSPRQSTVIAKETLELLAIDIKDFYDIFMSTGEKNVRDPDHEDFLRSMTFLKTWPIEKMQQQQDMCIFHYFKRGEILVKDSRYSDWIFVVKSGSLKVLKKLKRVSPFEDNIPKPEKVIKSEKEKKEERDLQAKQRRYILPDIHVPLAIAEADVPDVLQHPDDFPPSARARGYHNRLMRVMHSQTTPTSTQAPPTAAALSHGYGVTSVNSPVKLPRINDGNSLNRPKSWAGKEGTGDEDAIDAVLRSQDKKYKGIQLRKNAYVSKQPHGGTGEIKTKNSSRRAKSEKHTTKQKKSKKDIDEAEVRAEMGGRKQEIRTITDDLDAQYNKKYLTQAVTAADRDPQFVKLQTLTKGQVFGVKETLLSEQPGLCVISNGAECILIRKDFYVTHASDELLRHTRNELCPYPNDEEMQKSLQTTINWKAYRNITFNKTLKHLQDRKLTPR